jgi:4-diphosphocytidyl-2C-methyl-D-erythritol kinase
VTRKARAARAAAGAAVRIRSHAKVNLGLEVLGPRQDGYHELRTIFQTLELHDDLVLAPAPNAVTASCDHPGVPSDERNLAVRAAEALRAHAGVRQGVHIAITKRIPVAGGMGGGSSNAAAVLLALDRLWGLGLGRDGLHPLARRLGADVPFFLLGGTALEEAPELASQVERIRGILVREGALLTSLSGSGSSYFGLFREARQARRAHSALRDAGVRAVRSRALTLDRYRTFWARTLGPGLRARGWDQGRNGHHGNHGREGHPGGRREAQGVRVDRL